MKFRNVAEFISEYNNTKSGHFFSQSAMDFFKSEILAEIKKVGKDYYFMTTEKKCFDDNRRRGSIRKAENHEGKWVIRTIENQLIPSVMKKKFKEIKENEKDGI